MGGGSSAGMMPRHAVGQRYIALGTGLGEGRRDTEYSPSSFGPQTHDRNFLALDKVYSFSPFGWQLSSLIVAQTSKVAYCLNEVTERLSAEARFEAIFSYSARPRLYCQAVR